MINLRWGTTHHPETATVVTARWRSVEAAGGPARAVLTEVPRAAAQDAPKWGARVGISYISPKSNGGAVADVDDAASLTFNGTWFFQPHWGLELLAALPFEHDIKAKTEALGDVAVAEPVGVVPEQKLFALLGQLRHRSLELLQAFATQELSVGRAAQVSERPELQLARLGAATT